MRAAIYLRVSTDDQVENFGLDVQRERCEAMAKVKAWDVAEVFSDEGLSGTLDVTERPGLSAMMEAAGDGGRSADLFPQFGQGRLFHGHTRLQATGRHFPAPVVDGVALMREQDDLSGRRDRDDPHRPRMLDNVVNAGPAVGQGDLVLTHAIPGAGPDHAAGIGREGGWFVWFHRMGRSIYRIIRIEGIRTRIFADRHGWKDIGIKRIWFRIVR